ncbi:MAG: thiamine pyrophosphate-dependent dehydrogenase E1 component subunit alpha [Acidobacteria bacterium]|nr:thiamine pyrophosphate-dependent dehydrogenase E1 component subunit alpha [Acidobacteriota bacterium]
MRRYPAFDPPEYATWKPDPRVTAEYLKGIEDDPASAKLAATAAEAELLGLYEGMLRFRLHDIMLKRWVRQGVISKAWLGTGEEAVAVGNCRALTSGDVVGPMIRNAGACHEMGMPVVDMLKAYLGTRDTITRGRDLHTGDPSKGIIPPTSFVASLVPVMAGYALAFSLRNEPRVALTWVGDGATRTGEFHEGVSMAASQGLPLVVVLQDNRLALGTRYEVHSRAPLASLAAAYGVLGISTDGNSVIRVLAATRTAVARCRERKGPVLLTVSTFRMGGHATHDEAEGRAICSKEELAHHGARDPIGNYEEWLFARGVARARMASIEERVTHEVDAAAEAALAARAEGPAEPRDVLSGVYAEGTLTSRQEIIAKR